MDAVINLNKPVGISSFGAVARVRRLSGTRRVGHAGTLDPNATGVLPICLGRATRFSRYLVDAGKTYRATIELGITTDSYDAEGEVTARADASEVTSETVLKALEPFQGEILQTPPMHSALKYQGQPLYRLARQGISVAREPRRVSVARLELTDWQPPLVTLEIDCGKGFYVRSLAHDLGQALGCGAYLKALTRLRVGHLKLDGACSLAELEAAAAAGELDAWLLPIETLTETLPLLVLDETRAGELAQGKPVTLAEGEADADGVRFRVRDGAGNFIGAARREGEHQLRPERILGGGSGQS